jgi:hypothetical protein
VESQFFPLPLKSEISWIPCYFDFLGFEAKKIDATGILFTPEGWYSDEKFPRRARFMDLPIRQSNSISHQSSSDFNPVLIKMYVRFSKSLSHKAWHLSQVSFLITR